MPSRLHHLWSLLSTLTLLLGGQETFGTTIDRSPRPTILLKGAGKFLAQDGWDSVALYDAGNGQPLRRFSAGARVNKFDLTADEQFLLIVCADGSLSLWDAETGENVWRKTPRETGLDYVYDASFAHDRKSFVVCNSRDFALIGDTATGQQVGVVRFPAGQTDIMSACLSPDGSRGILIELGGKVFTFDAKTGETRDAGVTGTGPVRYSADGKYAALRSSNRGDEDWLRLLTPDANPSFRDVVRLGYVHLRPVGGGEFQVTGTRRDGNGVYAVGVRYRPATGEVNEVWTIEGGAEKAWMDFVPGSMRGVYTDWLLVTRLLDLRTGQELLKIDNSANSRPAIVTTSSGGDGGGVPAAANPPPAPQAATPWATLAVALGAVLVIILISLFLSRRWT